MGLNKRTCINLYTVLYRKGTALKWGGTIKPLLVCLFVTFLAQKGWGHSLSSLSIEVKRKGLPAVFFKDIQQFRHWHTLRIQPGQHDSYLPWSKSIILNESQFYRTASEWASRDWADFYNELFHAWWDLIFSREPIHRDLYQSLTTTYREKYRRAHPSNPILAQEEAYSETVSAISLLIAGSVSVNRLYYRLNFTVEPVGHSENPGFTELAEEIYPDSSEYTHIFFWLVGQHPPPIPAERPPHELNAYSLGSSGSM